MTAERRLTGPSPLGRPKPKVKECPECDGGNLVGVAPCSLCEGSGFILPVSADERNEPYAGAAWVTC